MENIAITNTGIASDSCETIREPKPVEPPAAHLDYVHAERDKRVRALWSENLVANQARMYLTELCGLSEETIKHHQIGLVSCRSEAAMSVIQQALCIPVPDKRGPQFAPCLAAENPTAKRRGQYVLLTFPGATLNAAAEQWTRGPILTMYITPQPEAEKDLLVCFRLVDAICFAQALELSCPGRFTVVTSTHGRKYPPEWSSPDFWVRWERVYLAIDESLEPRFTLPPAEIGYVDELVNVARRPLLSLPLPQSPDGVAMEWPTFLRTVAIPEGLRETLANAQAIKRGPVPIGGLSGSEPPRLGEFAEGEFGDVTHEVAYNYVGGYYYYPFAVLQFTLGAKNQKQITRLTRLLRNDGRILGWSRVPSVRGTSDVIAADDGTLLSRPPEVSDSATWSLPNILAYAKSTKTGRPACRPLSAIIRDIQKLIEECIWLPRREEIYLLLFTIPVTYVQELFDAVPYILIHGPKGSGKSELAHLLSWLCSNSTIIGSGSHAFTAAQIDQARGLIVLDDRETLGVDELDADLLELLKVGYKRATGTRGIIGQNRKIIRQHVYGVKAITCISGVEDIVGTRMLRIRTAAYYSGCSSRPIRRFQAIDQESANSLRQEMHCWAFQHLNTISAEYHRSHQAGSRWNEITAPLRTFSTLCEDPELQARLNDALSAQELQEIAEVPVEEVLNRSVEALIRRGLVTELSITQIRNELALKSGEYATQRSGCSVAPVLPESWITRTLKAQGWLRSNARVKRTRARKKVLQRIWEFDPVKVAAVLQKLPYPPEKLNALSFCQECGGCEYKHVCEIKKHFERRQ